MNSFNNTFRYDEEALIATHANNQSKRSCIIPTGFLEKENIPSEEPSLDNSISEENSKDSSHSQGKESGLVLSNDISSSLTNFKKVSKPNIFKQSISNTSSIHQLESKLEESKTQSQDIKNQFSQENFKKNPIVISDEALCLSRSHLERGNYRFFLGQYHDAKRHYKKALRLNPTFFEALHNYAMICYSASNRAKALKYLTKANKIRPTSKGYKLLGQLNNRKSFPLQKRLFSEALKLDPTDSEVHLLLGNMYTQFREFNLSKKSYYRVIEMCKNPENNQNQGDSLQLSNEWEVNAEFFSQEFSTIMNESQDTSFERMFGKGLKKAKTDFKAYFNGAQVLVEIGLFDKAMKTYKEIETKFPECRIPIYYKMAQLYILEKKFLDAAKMFAKVFVLPKKNIEDLTEERKVFLKNIDERSMKAHKRHSKRGHFFIKIGKLEEALAEFQASYDLSPNEYLSNWHLAKISLFLERIEEAAVMLEKARSINKKTNEHAKIIGVAFDSSIKALQI